MKRIFKASDGTQFDSEAECRKHEEQAVADINDAFHRLTKKEIFDTDVFYVIGQPCDGDITYIVHIGNTDDVNTVNKKIKSSPSYHEVYSSIIPESCVGKDIVIKTYAYNDDVDYEGTVDEYVGKWVKWILRLFDVE